MIQGKTYSVHQFLPSIRKYDGISDETRVIQKYFLEKGINSHIYATSINGRFPNTHKYRRYRYKKGDIIINHLSVGDEINDFVANQRAKKILIFHNFTPGKFFKNYEELTYKVLDTMAVEIKRAKGKYDVVYADSEFNAKTLEDMGFKDVQVLPIIYDFDKAKGMPLNKKLEDEIKTKAKVNLLFLGRIAPNKAQIDLVRTFSLYNKYYNKDSRLYLVGNTRSSPAYYRELVYEIEAAKLHDKVIIASDITDQDKNTFYSTCDLLVSMSEHEGFFIPALECLNFGLPMMVYGDTASVETPGNAAIYFKDKDYAVIAEMIDMVIKNKDLRKELIQRGRERLEYFNPRKNFEKLMKSVASLA